MRKKYITSLIKLPIIFFILFYSSFIFAKKEDNETNIVCFAAKNKWICAPEDQQNIANEKATELLEEKSLDVGSSDVVIKPINIPKFNANNTFDSAEYVKLQPQQDSTENKILDNNESLSNTELDKEKMDQQSGIKLKETSSNNPYAHLWSHQLIGVSTSQNAINYVNQKNLNKDEVLILKSTRANKDWWIVLYGLYKDKQTGIENTQYLPPNIDPPWLRPLKNLEVKGFIDSF